MIVKCEQCQTRFKIPDDKVTDKGVKVRCTKCSHTFRVTRDMAQPATAALPAVPALGATPAAPAPAGDPFARFGAVADPPSAEVTRPGVFALGVEATRSPELGLKRPPTAPPFPASPPPAAAAPFDFGSLAPPAQTQPSMPAVQVPAYPPPAPVPSPFDFAAIAPPSAASPAPAPAAFDFSTFAAPTQPPPPPARGVSPPPPAAQTPAFDFSPPPAMDMPPPAPQLPAFDFGARPQSSAPMDEGLGAPPPSMHGSADGFFASAEAVAPLSNVDGEAARAMFDMPTAPPAALPDVPLPEGEKPTSAGSVSVERVSLSKPAVAPPTPQLPPDEPPPRRSVVGIVVNVAIAAVLVVGLVVIGSAFLNEGKVSADSLSFENLKNTFAPSVEFVASDVSNGLYETRAGRSVFFVRGEVTNRSQAAVKVVVKAEIVEDGKVVRFGESWAGDPATPEEIYLIDSSEALEALNRRVEKRSLVVPPDSAATFVVPFTEYPPELKGFRVRVSARAVPANPTAANP